MRNTKAVKRMLILFILYKIMLIIIVKTHPNASFYMLLQWGRSVDECFQIARDNLVIFRVTTCCIT